MKSGFIYLMKTRDAPFFKIGQAGDPEERRRNLQTGCPYPLEIVEKWNVRDVNDAELHAHTVMSDYNRARWYPNLNWNTEWFQLEGITLANVQQQLDKIMKNYN